MSGIIVSREVVKSEYFIVHLFCSVFKRPHTDYNITCNHTVFSRWKYVSMSVIEFLCEQRSLSVMELTLPSV